MLGTIVVNLLDSLFLSRDCCLLTIAETGTMFKLDLEPGEDSLKERSTFAITRWIQRTGVAHKFYSIDSDVSHIDICRRGLRDLADNVCHYKSSGVQGLRDINERFDFVLLDADSNAEATLAEFNVVSEKMRTNGIIVVDDAFKHVSVNKARLIMRSGVKHFALRNQAIGIPYGPLALQILESYSKL